MLKAGIIGLGVGEAHIAGYESGGRCRVVALCDRDPARRAAAAKRYPEKKIYENDVDLLHDPEIDVVSIASYDDCHHAQVTAALSQNKHVFVEKPLCLHEREAREIRNLLNTRPHLKLSSNLILRKSPRFVELKRMIADGKLGELFHIEGDYNYGRLHKITEGWRGDLDFYSVVLGGGIHLIDLFLWLTGDRVIEAAACGNRISSRSSKFRYDDMVVCILKFAGGMTGKLGVNFGCVQPHFHNLAVYGTSATFVNGRDRGLLYRSRDPETAPDTLDSAYPGIHKGGLIASFVDAVVDDTEPEVTAEDVFRAMSVCFAVERAGRESAWIAVDYI